MNGAAASGHRGAATRIGPRDRYARTPAALENGGIERSRVPAAFQW